MRQKLDRYCRVINDAVASSWFLKLTFIWFLAQAIYFALTVRLGLPPDENYHYTYIQLYAQHWPSPFLSDNGIPSVLMEVARNPFFLYHYLLGWPYLVFKHLPHPYIYLRLINVAMGAGSLWVTYKIARFLKVPSMARNLAIFMLSSTLMFAFLPAGINYDNMMILLGLAAVYLFLRLWHTIVARDLLALILVLLAGILTKVNFLPLAFILVALLVEKHIRVLPSVWLHFRRSWNLSRRWNLFLSVLVILLAALSVQRYVVNEIDYGSYNPPCQRVRTIDDCRQSALFTRNEALAAHPRKRTDGPVRYVVDWAKLMEQRTYGVFAQQRLPVATYIGYWVGFISILGAAALIIKRFWQSESAVLLMVISAFTALALIADNYSTYRHYGIVSLAVQGRYLFTALPLLYLLVMWYMIKLFDKRQLLIASLAVATIVIFGLSSLPHYLHHLPATWSHFIASSVRFRLGP